VGEETLARIDPASNQVSANIDLGKGYMQVKFGNASLWTMGSGSGTIKRVDPQLAKVVEEFSCGRGQDNGMLRGPIEGGLYFFTAVDGMLWVADNKRMSNGKYVLSRYDPNTHERLAKIEADDSNGPPVIWNGAVWLSSMGYLTKVSVQTNHVASRVLLSAPDRGRAFAGSLLTDGDTLWAIDSGSWAYSRVIISRIQTKVPDAGGN
jgi:virginiamycin B lyase